MFVTYYPHYRDTEEAEAIFGTFSTTDAYNSKVNYFVNEFFGTLMLVLGALCCLSLPWGAANPAAASIVVGFIVWGLVTSMGGPTGPGLNPARDLMPRLLHQLLPIPHKGSSRWGEAWIPVVAPILGAIVGAWAVLHAVRLIELIPVMVAWRGCRVQRAMHIRRGIPARQYNFRGGVWRER